MEGVAHGRLGSHPVRFRDHTGRRAHRGREVPRVQPFLSVAFGAIGRIPLSANELTQAVVTPESSSTNSYMSPVLHLSWRHRCLPSVGGNDYRVHHAVGGGALAFGL